MTTSKYVSDPDEVAKIPVGTKTTDPDGYGITRVEGGWTYDDRSYPAPDDVWSDEEMLDRWGCIIFWESE